MGNQGFSRFRVRPYQHVACRVPINMSPCFPRHLNEPGRSAYSRTRHRRPKYPAVQTGEGGVLYGYLRLGSRSILHAYIIPR